MGLSKEVLTEIVPKILAGDQKAFALFYDEYKQVVVLHAGKWFWSINKITLGLYDFDDICNELWEHVIMKLPDYDPRKSTMTTFMYIVCGHGAERIKDYYGRQKRFPGEDFMPAYLDNNTFGEDEDLKMLDLIVDPVNHIEDDVISEISLFEHIYFLKDFIARLNQQQKTVYLHMVRGLTLQQSGDILCISRERVRQIRNKIQEKIFRQKSLIKQNSDSKSDLFSVFLLSDKSDDEISEDLDCDLATVKICREILIIADLYHRPKEE